MQYFDLHFILREAERFARTVPDAIHTARVRFLAMTFVGRSMTFASPAMEISSPEFPFWLRSKKRRRPRSMASEKPSRAPKKVEKRLATGDGADGDELGEMKSKAKQRKREEVKRVFCTQAATTIGRRGMKNYFRPSLVNISRVIYSNKTEK